MATMSLDRLNFDPTSISAGPTIGSYIISDGGEIITHTTDGSRERLDVNADIELSDPESLGIYIEDEAGAGGENGQFILGRRQDANTSPVSADGDYHGLLFNENDYQDFLFRVAGNIR